MLHWLAEAIGAKNLRQRRHKDIGDLLRACWDAKRGESDELRKAVEVLDLQSVIRPLSAADGLAGVYLASLRGFDFAVDDFWGSPWWLMAHLQIGAADILHVCIARHLGCQYFVSFDGDFKRVREEMDSEMGLQLLCTPQELLDAMRRYPSGEDRADG